MHDIDSCWLINCIFFFILLRLEKHLLIRFIESLPSFFFSCSIWKSVLNLENIQIIAIILKYYQMVLNRINSIFVWKKDTLETHWLAVLWFRLVSHWIQIKCLLLRSYNKSRCLHVFKCGLDVAILNVPWYSAYTMFSMEYLLLLNLTFRLNFLHSTETFWQTQRILCNRGYCGQGEDIIHWPKLIVLSLWHVLPKILTRGKKFGN